jgi:hypothetical protein
VIFFGIFFGILFFADFFVHIYVLCESPPCYIFLYLAFLGFLHFVFIIRIRFFPGILSLNLAILTLLTSFVNNKNNRKYYFCKDVFTLPSYIPHTKFLTSWSIRQQPAAALAHADLQISFLTSWQSRLPRQAWCGLGLTILAALLTAVVQHRPVEDEIVSVLFDF